MNKKAKYAADLTAENAKLRETVEEMKLELVAAKSLGEFTVLIFFACTFIGFIKSE